ncbi:MAG: hypothetical protein MUQ43_01655 [Reinekea forsetii]|nr:MULTISPECIES: hypothetical protein [Reinekea]MDO7641946.1 hypothetical protein [Reinekea forsetii]MDO7645848.1 hypothetical protein [Reinekea forsetii]MDO7673109.1 hypothetical protein [Reinekea forsetii]
MPRKSKSRSMKGLLGVKTGSKKDFIKQGEMGKIPSHNRLEKHKHKRMKSAYQQFLEENGLKDSSSGLNTANQRLAQAQADAKAKPEVVKPKKPERVLKDFNTLSGDELLDLFN